MMYSNAYTKMVGSCSLHTTSIVKSSNSNSNSKSAINNQSIITAYSQGYWPTLSESTKLAAAALDHSRNKLVIEQPVIINKVNDQSVQVDLLQVKEEIPAFGLEQNIEQLIQQPKVLINEEQENLIIENEPQKKKSLKEKEIELELFSQEYKNASTEKRKQIYKVAKEFLINIALKQENEQVQNQKYSVDKIKKLRVSEILYHYIQEK